MKIPLHSIWTFGFWSMWNLRQTEHCLPSHVPLKCKTRQRKVCICTFYVRFSKVLRNYECWWPSSLTKSVNIATVWCLLWQHASTCIGDDSNWISREQINSWTVNPWISYASNLPYNGTTYRCNYTKDNDHILWSPYSMSLPRVERYPLI